ncbi:hypothetical protein R3W88_002012 [Solanum pinnatisectum]|uniref:Uncharacterized protein n=1 Tax=Solanum pinnatisectum TaxID=50273 RepID=A0AAV9MMM1_9SOLN|nr:hypothetical protein R3W88_002012 [Solanum pinnatisectum]
MANIGAKEKKEFFFTDVTLLPTQVKVVVKIDQDQLPNLRVRIKRKQFNFRNE